MLLQRIQQHFVDSADLQYQCAQQMAPAVEAATAAVLASLTGGSKVLAGGSGVCSGLVSGFVAALVGRFERERPELAALALGSNPALVSGLYQAFDPRAVLARPVRALGLPGDVLVLLTDQPALPEVLAAVEAAHEREMVVVALCGARAGVLGTVLKDTDVLICAPTERLPRLLEAQLVALHAVCDGVDVQLLGEDPDLENEA